MEILLFFGCPNTLALYGVKTCSQNLHSRLVLTKSKNNDEIEN